MNEDFKSIYVGPARVRITQILNGSHVFEVWVDEPYDGDIKTYAYSGPLAHVHILNGETHALQGWRMLFRGSETPHETQSPVSDGS